MGEELMVGDTVQVCDYAHLPRRKEIGVVVSVLHQARGGYPIYVNFGEGKGYKYFSAKELKLLTNCSAKEPKLLANRDEELYY